MIYTYIPVLNDFIYYIYFKYIYHIYLLFVHISTCIPRSDGEEGTKVERRNIQGEEKVVGLGRAAHRHAWSHRSAGDRVRNVKGILGRKSWLVSCTRS